MSGQQDPGEPIGTITHYFNHLSVAAVNLTGELRVGDRIRISGHSTDLDQVIESLEVEHTKVERAGPGDDVALKVAGRVHEHDGVFRVSGTAAQ
jgi:putative protease